MVHASHPAEGRQLEHPDEPGDEARVREADGFAGPVDLLSGKARLMRYKGGITVRLILMVTGLLLAVLGPAFADAASEYQAGLNAYNQGNYVEAIRHYSNVIKLESNYRSQAYVARGNAYSDSGQLDLAIADYSEAIRLFPDYAGGYSNRAIVYYKKKEFDRAMADVGKAIQLKPDCAFCYVARGNFYDDKGLTDLALADYAAAIKADPRFHRSYGERASTYLRLGQLDNAMTDVNKAIELNPRYTFAYIVRGTVYEKKGDRDNAISDYRKALALDANRMLARQGLQRLGVEP
jgi:tetratricopeptide (TPR) repeat protein